MNSCYRCDKTCVTPKYNCRSDYPVHDTKNLEELKTLWDSRIKEQKTAKNKSYITPKEVQSVIKAYS